MSENNVEFSGLVLGFCSAALSYMGYGDSSTTENLALAKQNIDILGLLSEKTKGNLSEEEERLLKDALLDLRTKFTDRQKNS